MSCSFFPNNRVLSQHVAPHKIQTLATWPTTSCLSWQALCCRVYNTAQTLWLAFTLHLSVWAGLYIFYKIYDFVDISYQSCHFFLDISCFHVRTLSSLHFKLYFHLKECCLLPLAWKLGMCILVMQKIMHFMFLKNYQHLQLVCTFILVSGGESFTFLPTTCHWELVQ